MTTAPLRSKALDSTASSTAERGCSRTHAWIGSPSTPRPCCRSAPGAVTYPSSDIEMSAMTLLMLSPRSGRPAVDGWCSDADEGALGGFDRAITDADLFVALPRRWHGGGLGEHLR